MIASGHSHGLYDCRVGDVVVTSAGDYGRAVTQIDLAIDRASGEVTSVDTENVLISDTAAADPEATAIVDHYGALVAPLRDAVIATITADISNVVGPSGEKPMGAVVADAMLDATGAELALMNTGGVRTSLLFAASGAESEDGQVTYGEAYAVQPFANLVETLTLTGAEIEALLEAFITEPGPAQIAGGSYVWSASAPAGSKIDPADIAIGGVPLELDRAYRVAVNSIVAQSIPDPVDPVGAGVDLDLLVAYLGDRSPVSPPAPRITVVP